MAQGLNSDATNALKEPSYNLLNNTPETALNTAASMQNTLNQESSNNSASYREIFGLYNNIAKNGVYTVMNYGAIGMILNMNI